MEYISERIVNIAELEKNIQTGSSYFRIMSAEMKKEAPSIEKINEAAQVVKKHLEQAESFLKSLWQRG